MKFVDEHTLPLLALQATWAAVQQRQEKKLLTIEALLGRKGSTSSGEPMTKETMQAEVLTLADFTKKMLNKKKEKEG